MGGAYVGGKRGGVARLEDEAIAHDTSCDSRRRFFRLDRTVRIWGPITVFILRERLSINRHVGYFWSTDNWFYDTLYDTFQMFIVS